MKFDITKAKPGVAVDMFDRHGALLYTGRILCVFGFKRTYIVVNVEDMRQHFYFTKNGKQQGTGRYIEIK